MSGTTKITTKQLNINNNLDLQNNSLKNGGFEVVSSLPTTNLFVGRKVCYGGKDYIYNGTAWTNDATTLEGIGINDILPKLNTPRGNLGNPSVFEAALINSQFTNKLWFYPSAAFLFERSTDDITYTEDSTVSPLSLVSGNSNSNIAIPKGSCLRMTITSQGYVNLNMLYMYYSMNGDAMFIKIEKYNSLNAIWTTVMDYTNGQASWPNHISVRHDTIPFYNVSTAKHYSKVRVTIKVNPDTSGGVYPNHFLYGMEWWGGYPSGSRYIYSWDNIKNVYFPAAVQSNETINCDINTIAPTQTGKVTKTSTWWWQYLTQSINYTWLKLKTWVGGLFSAGSVTTNDNYLPKIDDVNKKLVKSNISDDGSRVQIYSPLRVNTNSAYSPYKALDLTGIGIFKLVLPPILYKTFTLDISINKPTASNIIINSFGWANGLYDRGSVFISGHPIRVRLAYDGTNYCVLLGSLDTNWTYTGLIINKITTNFNYDMSVGWGHSIITSEDNLSNIIEPIVNANLDVDKLDGKHASDFATSTHNHNTTYLGIDASAVSAKKLTNEITITDFNTFNPVTLGLAIGESCNFIADSAIGRPTFGVSTICTGTIQHVYSGMYIYLAYAGTNTSLYPFQYAIGGYNSGFEGWQLRNAQGILDLVKTVDGTGSGLDADLLDGKHASDFALSSHTHISSQITDLSTVLAKYLLLGGGTLTGDLTTKDIYPTEGESIYIGGSENTYEEVWAKYFRGLADEAAKVTNGLRIQYNGTTQGSFNGSEEVIFNITPSSIGAANSSHTHTKSQITDLTVDAALSSISTNPVQNKIVNTAINSKFSTSGGLISGNVQINPYSAGYSEGIRIANAPNNYSAIILGCDTSYGYTGTNVGMWAINKNSNNTFSIKYCTSAGSALKEGLTLNPDGDATWKGNTLACLGNIPVGGTNQAFPVADIGSTLTTSVYNYFFDIGDNTFSLDLTSSTTLKNIAIGQLYNIYFNAETACNIKFRDTLLNVTLNLTRGKRVKCEVLKISSSRAELVYYTIN